jgi:hypothetical protein
MKNYQYDPLSPEALDALISGVVQRWAAKRDLQYEPWYHGLPIWIVSARTDNRTVKVQIEMILAESISRLSFTPDAFEDEVTEQAGVRTVKRRIAEAEDLRKWRFEIPIESLISRDALTVSAKGQARDEIETTLESSWKAAQSLTMTSEPMRIQYVPAS